MHAHLTLALLLGHDFRSDLSLCYSYCAVVVVELVLVVVAVRVNFLH